MWAVTEPRDKPSLPILMTLSQLAEYLQVDLSRVYELLRHDHVPYLRIGSEIRFDQY